MKHLTPTAPRMSVLDKCIGLIERKPLSDRLFLRLAFFAFMGSLVYAGLTINQNHVAVTPTTGGRLVEGVVGIPRFVNPILAITRADQDMTALIYSGLMKIGENGALALDVAEQVNVSDDGRTYNINLKRNVRFHDGSPLTARDVAYTIALIQNPDLKSPLRGNWNGVLVEELGEHELNIVLEEPYAPFIENLTVGILPRHVWQELPIEQLPFSQHNTEPVGSGPFEIDTVQRNQSGLIDSYTLTPFQDAVTVPKLDQIVVRFFQNELALQEAFAAGELMGTTNLPASYLTSVDENTYRIIEEPMPRVFSIFFNQNRSAALRDDGARTALSIAIDREQLVREVLDGHGVPNETPVPPGFLGVESRNLSTTTSTSTPLAAARELLVASGWSQDEVGSWVKDISGEEVVLSVTIRTANSALFESATTFVAAAWRELGVEVRVEQFEQADLLQAVIRPRDFEALFFGIDMSRAVDLYPFWHSSQKDDPGLNISQYANIEVDALLANALIEPDPETRITTLNDAADIISEEHPAIFLFTPTMQYVLDRDVHTVPITNISKPYERFMNIESWHANTEILWPLFRTSAIN